MDFKMYTKQTTIPEEFEPFNFTEGDFQGLSDINIQDTCDNDYRLFENTSDFYGLIQENDANYENDHFREDDDFEDLEDLEDLDDFDGFDGFDDTDDLVDFDDFDDYEEDFRFAEDNNSWNYEDYNDYYRTEASMYTNQYTYMMPIMFELEDDDEEFARSEYSSEVNDTLVKIEENNQEVFNLLALYNVPYSVARKAIRRVSRLTLMYNK